jgi:Na+/proline symporter
MKGVYFIILIAMIVILALSALILYLHDRVSWKFWQRLVQIADTIGINYMASSFGFVGAGVSLLKYGWLALGIVLLVIGALLLGAGIGANLWELHKQVSAKVGKN